MLLIDRCDVDGRVVQLDEHVGGSDGDAFVPHAERDRVRLPPLLAEQAVALQNGTILIGVRPDDDIWMAKRQIELREVRQMVERAKSENPEGSVVIIADKGSKIGTVTQVMDQVRLAGVEGISISADQPGG